MRSKEGLVVIMGLWGGDVAHEEEPQMHELNPTWTQVAPDLALNEPPPTVSRAYDAKACAGP